jgi:ribokinase
VPEPRVVVVGSINVDLVVAVPRLPAAGETVTGGTFAHHGGGKGANQAVAAARLGADVTLVGAVGDDEMGTAAVAELAAEGIDVSAIARLSAATGVALIAVDAEGENQIAVASGANAALDAATVTAELAPRLDSPRGVVLLNHEIPEEAILAACASAAAAGWQIVLNPAPAREIPAAVLDARPLLTPNASEAAQLTGQSRPEAAAQALARRTGAAVLVTLGARGALLVEPGRDPLGLPAPQVAVKDTTGAGDTVNGALAAELAAGRELADAARFALAAAALSTRAAGARGGMPLREEVLGAA